jgi:exodeoxyribonuclease V
MSDIKLNEGQQDAFDMVGVFKADPAVYIAVITGYAGTGKTTLIKVMAQAHGPVHVLAPTGKAALRITEATGIQGSTIHRFIYKPATDQKTGQPIFTLKGMDELGGLGGSLLIVDEASMVDQKLWVDLLTVAKLSRSKIILMGDLFQLPPVQKDKDGGNWSALDIATEYKVNLTEVHRQALDSAIVRASMILRSNAPEHKALSLIRSIGAKKMLETLIDYRSRNGVTIVHTNASRHRINNQVREHIGMAQGTIKAGEPVLVLANNYRVGRYNGEVLTFDSWVQEPSERMSGVVSDRWANVSMNMSFGLATVEGDQVMVSPEEICGKAEEKKVGVLSIKKGSEGIYRQNFTVNSPEDVVPHLHCSYGYALTCHKSQGSEWGDVLVVIEDSLHALKGQERKRWLYTSLTRAKTNCSYVYLPKE